ncbi:hypothetical protein O6H91_18G045900 [Diphasiastrum complanatum]|uniref:Uncharacterized protein n=1 Tax=Diphasiastrum complanatum TaxID=34168 RepID=A0ACC2B0K5_DIPCM|nr:hypothetical protein O6H91_18G045900 [Diphasiastrum complanatum]
MDFIAAHIEELTAELRKHLKLDQNSNTNTQHFNAQALLAPILGFIHAVDWTEPWIICVLVFHLFLLVLVVKSRKHVNVQMAIFLFGVLGVYCAEYLNTLLSRNWTHFARQQYFDPFGEQSFHVGRPSC